MNDYRINENIEEETFKKEPGFLIYTDRIYYKRCLVPDKAHLELSIHKATFKIIHFYRIYGGETLTDEEFNMAEDKLQAILDELTMKGILTYEYED